MIESKGWYLTHNDGSPVKIGDEVLFGRYGRGTVLGATAPLHDQASGRVYLQMLSGYKREVYPHECGLIWKAVNDDQV